jgi:hypothetical protein
MKLLNIFKNEKASSLILMAILMPIIIMLIAFVIDIGGSIMLKEELYKACLISAEEASKIIDLNKAQNEGVNNLSSSFEDTINDYFRKNFKPMKNSSLKNLNYKVVSSIENPKFVLVTGEANYKTFFLKFIGIENINVHSQAQGRLKRIK